MSNKIEIEITDRGCGSVDFTVSQNDRYADRLTFDEMLGLVATLTMPELRQCTAWMKSKAEWDEWNRMLNEIRNEPEQVLEVRS